MSFREAEAAEFRVRLDHLERDVGELKRDMAKVRADIAGMKAALLFIAAAVAYPILKDLYGAFALP